MTDRLRIVFFYAVWAALCAAAAGAAISLIHTAFYSGATGSAFVRTLLGDLGVAVALAAGQGAVALAAGGVLARLGRTLRMTVLLGLLVGLFDFAMYFLQMAVPATELGWVPDLIILAAVVAGVTALGSASKKGV